MQRTPHTVLPSALAAWLVLSSGSGLLAKDYLVTTTDNAAAGSLRAALADPGLADGDVIKFNIPGDGPHVIVTPLGGYPLIQVNNLTIDGYSQPGSKPNSNGILGGNNAVLKIVLDSSGTDSRATANPDLPDRRSTRLPFSGYGNSENAILGVNEADGFKARGLAFLGRYVEGSDADPAIYAVALVREAKNAKVQGCWFGLKPGDPAAMESLKPVTSAVAAFRWRDASNQNPVYSGGLTVGTDGDGVADVQEFNVMVGCHIAIAIEAPDLRVSGNYVNVFPDGLSFVDVEAVQQGYAAAGNDTSIEFLENGRETTNTVIGTNGDGKSDGNERNIVAHAVYDHDIEFYSNALNVVVAGNYFGVGVDGTTAQAALTTKSPNFLSLPGTSAARVGSNGDGVSDDLEGNVIQGVPGTLLVAGGATSRAVVRRNRLVGNAFSAFPFADGENGRAYDAYYAPVLLDPGTGVAPVIASITAGIMTGTVPAPANGAYPRHVVDVYVVDPQAAEKSLNHPGRHAGSFVEGGVGDLDATANRFRVDLRGMKVVPGDSVALAITYTAGTNSTPATNSLTAPLSAAVVADVPVQVPGSIESIGLTRLVPDKAVIVPAGDALGNWEPNASVLGNSTFLIEGNTYAAGSLEKQRFVVAVQPADGRAGRTVEGFYSDAGQPYAGEINASRQNGNPGRVAGDKRPGATTYVVGAEASPHNYAEFNSGNRWNPGYNRVAPSGLISRYGTVQAFRLNLPTLEPTPLSKALDSAWGRQGTGQVASDQNTRFGGDVAFLSNGNYVSVVEDRSSLLRQGGNAAAATILRPDGTVVKETFKIADGDQWANVAAFRGGFAVRNGSTIYLHDNDGNPTGSFNQATSGVSFSTGRGDGTRIAGHIHSPYIFIFGKPAAENVVKLAVWDTRDPQRFATFDVSEPAFVGNVDRANLAVDALNRVTAAWVSSPDGYEQQQVAARVLALNGDTMTLTALTPSFFPFINAAKTGDIRSVGMTVAMTTRQICVAAKGEINLENKPANGATINPATGAPLREVNFYTVFSHPAPADDPTAGAESATPAVAIRRNPDGTLTLTWTGTLQGAENLGGPFQPENLGASPQTIPATAAQRFYRAQ